jgi:hypothetical protein
VALLLLFFYLGQYDNQGVAVAYNPHTGFPQQFWVRGNTADAIPRSTLTTRAVLDELIPEYYQMKDQEFLAGTGRKGVVERMLQTVGFETDYTKTWRMVSSTRLRHRPDARRLDAQPGRSTSGFRPSRGWAISDTAPCWRR